jgi:hypothetical protein
MNPVSFGTKKEWDQLYRRMELIGLVGVLLVFGVKSLGTYLGYQFGNEEVPKIGQGGEPLITDFPLDGSLMGPTSK